MLFLLLNMVGVVMSPLEVVSPILGLSYRSLLLTPSLSMFQHSSLVTPFPQKKHSYFGVALITYQVLTHSRLEGGILPSPELLPFHHRPLGLAHRWHRRLRPTIIRCSSGSCQRL
jgi:hypothetical protein